MKRTGLIVGLGSIGRRHLQNFRQHREQDEILVLRRQGDGGEAVGMGADRLLTSLDEAFDAKPSWAVIASPATRHAEFAVELAAAGSHLLVEKPLAADLPAARRIVDACRRHNRVLMTGYNLRFDACLQRMKQEVVAGTIGTIYGLHATVGQYLPDWRPTTNYRDCVSAKRCLGGGALRELSHELDYVQWIAGGKMQVVSAVVDRLSDLDIDVEDWADLVLRRKCSPSAGDDSAVNAYVHLDFLSRVAHRSCRVTGSNGSLLWDAISRRLTLLQPGKVDILVDQAHADRNASYMAMTMHFLERIEREEGFSPTDHEGLLAIEVIEQAESLCCSPN